MKSIETQFEEIREVWKENGKESEAAAIIKEAAGKPLEYKLDQLVTKARAFSGTSGKTELVESYMKNLGFTLKEARIAAGLDRSHRNDGYAWGILSEAKGK